MTKAQATRKMQREAQQKLRRIHGYLDVVEQKLAGPTAVTGELVIDGVKLAAKATGITLKFGWTVVSSAYQGFKAGWKA